MVAFQAVDPGSIPGRRIFLSHAKNIMYFYLFIYLFILFFFFRQRYDSILTYFIVILFLSY